MNATPALQRFVRAGRHVFPRGWAVALRAAARAHPPLRRYACEVDGGERLVVDLRDPMCMGYFFHGTIAHEPGTVALLQRVLRPGGVFVDVGANVGYFSAMAARLVGPAGRVVAFEPLPLAADLLEANLARYPWAAVRREAVADAPGSASFSAMPSGDLSGLGVREGAREVLTVPLVTLDDALAGLPRLDLLKIDVEGGEAPVLRGAASVIRRLRPLVYAEALDGPGPLADVLASVGYRPASEAERAAHGLADEPYVLAVPDSPSRP